MTFEMCRSCGGSGSNLDMVKPGPCPKCKGKGYQELAPVIDAELVQEKKRAPYRFRNMTIREVPIREKPFPFRKAKDGLKIWGNTHRSE